MKSLLILPTLAVMSMTLAPALALPHGIKESLRNDKAGIDMDLDIDIDEDLELIFSLNNPPKIVRPTATVGFPASWSTATSVTVTVTGTAPTPLSRRQAAQTDEQAHRAMLEAMEQEMEQDEYDTDDEEYTESDSAYDDPDEATGEFESDSDKEEGEKEEKVPAAPMKKRSWVGDHIRKTFCYDFSTWKCDPHRDHDREE